MAKWLTIFHVNESTLRFWKRNSPRSSNTKKQRQGTRNYTKTTLRTSVSYHFLLKGKRHEHGWCPQKAAEEKDISAQHELSDILKKNQVRIAETQSELGQPGSRGTRIP